MSKVSHLKEKAILADSNDPKLHIFEYSITDNRYSLHER